MIFTPGRVSAGRTGNVWCEGKKLEVAGAQKIAKGRRGNAKRLQKGPIGREKLGTINSSRRCEKRGAEHQAGKLKWRSDEDVTKDGPTRPEEKKTFSLRENLCSSKEKVGEIRENGDHLGAQ